MTFVRNCSELGQAVRKIMSLKVVVFYVSSDTHFVQ